MRFTLNLQQACKDHDPGLYAGTSLDINSLVLKQLATCKPHPGQITGVRQKCFARKVMCMHWLNLGELLSFRRPLELDTDGIWCVLPASFPENFQVMMLTFYSPLAKKHLFPWHVRKRGTSFICIMSKAVLAFLELKLVPLWRFKCL